MKGVLPATKEFPWPTIPFNVEDALLFLAACQNVDVRYVLGGKVPFGGALPGVDYDALDCSGFVRELIHRASNGKAAIVDGSVQQREQVERVGFKRSAVVSAKALDGAVRIAFLSPEDSRSRVGHVAIVVNGQTIESAGGKGPCRRKWTGSGWQALAKVWVLREPVPK